MRSFVVGLVQKHIEHTPISIKGPQRSKMTVRGRHECWNSRDRLQKDDPSQDFGLSNIARMPQTDRIKTKSHHTDRPFGNLSLVVFG